MLKTALLPNVNVTCITTDQYKTNALSVYLVRPLLEEEAAMNALLPQVLCRGNVQYPTMQAMSEALDDLYGSMLLGGTRKRGEHHLFGLGANFVGDAFTGTPQTVSMIQLMAATLLTPALQDGMFHTAYVDSERENLIAQIRALKNDKASYSSERLDALACPHEPFAVPNLGSEEQASCITTAALWQYYKQALSTSRIEIFYCGQTKADVIAQHFQDAFAHITMGQVVVSDSQFVASADTTRDFTDCEDITQAKLGFLWRTGVPAGHPDFLAAYVASVLYGGGTTSKLFTHVRERLSLCYYASAYLERHKGIIKAQSGVDMGNIDVARKEMLSQWEEIVLGHFTDEDFADAKSVMRNAWRSKADSPGGLEDFWQGQAVAQLCSSLDDWSKQLNDVTKEDVCRVASGFTLDATYCMRAQ